MTTIGTIESRNIRTDKGAFLLSANARNAEKATVICKIGAKMEGGGDLDLPPQGKVPITSSTNSAGISRVHLGPQEIRETEVSNTT